MSIEVVCLNQLTDFINDLSCRSTNKLLAIKLTTESNGDNKVPRQTLALSSFCRVCQPCVGHLVLNSCLIPCVGVMWRYI